MASGLRFGQAAVEAASTARSLNGQVELKARLTFETLSSV